MSTEWTNYDGPYILDLCSGRYMPSIVVQDVDGELNYLVPIDPNTGQVYSNIPTNLSIYEWADSEVQGEGYDPLAGNYYITVDGHDSILVLAYNFKTNTYDLIAFRVTSETVEEVTTYTANQAVLITAGESVDESDSYQQWIEGNGRSWLTTFIARSQMPFKSVGRPTPASFDFIPQYHT